MRPNDPNIWCLNRKQRRNFAHTIVGGKFDYGFWEKTSGKTSLTSRSTPLQKVRVKINFWAASKNIDMAMVMSLSRHILLSHTPTQQRIKECLHMCCWRVLVCFLSVKHQFTMWFEVNTQGAPWCTKIWTLQFSELFVQDALATKWNIKHFLQNRDICEIWIKHVLM